MHEGERKVNGFRLILTVAALATFCNALGSLVLIIALGPFDKDTFCMAAAALEIFGVGLWTSYIGMLSEKNWLREYIECVNNKKELETKNK